MKFKFNGDWQFKLKLERFAIINNQLRETETLHNPIFEFEILDEYNSNPDPETNQINTINFLLNEDNQILILKHLLEYSKNIIYPHYKNFLWESEHPECYPVLKKEVDLSKLLSINRIIIKRIQHQDYSYYILDCNSCLDLEHGITITLFKDKVIDHGENWDDRKVCIHKGIDYASYSKNSVENYNRRELILSDPHPKYGKLKPWQQTQNDHYPFKLFQEQRHNELLKAIEIGIVPKEPIISRILALAISDDRESLIQDLIKQKPKYKYAAFKEALNKDRFDLTDLLLRQGYNLNEKVAQSSLFYETIGHMTSAAPKSKLMNNLKKRLRYLLDNGLDPHLEDNFNRNSFYRIKQINDEKLKIKVNKEVNSVMGEKLNFFNRIMNTLSKLRN